MAGELMEREIREQPKLLANLANEYHGQLSLLLAGKHFDMVLLAARGSSDHAALYARYLIEIHLGVPVCLAAPSVLTQYGVRIKYPNCLAIGISQSGEAPDVAEVLEAMRNAGHTTLAITNSEDTRITMSAEHSLLLRAGAERSVAATKTYTCSLLALYQLARALGAVLPDATGNTPTCEWLSEAERSARAVTPILLGRPVLFSLGRGYSYATALETALKLMECALLPCKGYSVADFQHGPRALAGPGTAAICFEKCAPDLGQHGCAVLEAPNPLPGPLSPLWQAIYAQWLALHCARERNLDPDSPAHLAKVTRTL